ncbi:MAG TPA: hypothetical protein DGH68_06315 [Bacteroidetes bacterium]|jgi:hypothetical protein|nr:hypothetical protein [Bacteroidota bacterium]
MNRASLVFIAVCLLCISALAHAQFKSQVESESRVSEGLMSQTAPQLFLGWFNPDKFHMHHTFDLSFTSFGRNAVSLGTYTNSMSYEFADNLRARTDLSMSYSPYNNLPTLNGKKNDLSSIYLSRAQLDYKPWENFLIQLQYRSLPYGSYYGSQFFNPWYRENGF